MAGALLAVRHWCAEAGGVDAAGAAVDAAARQQLVRLR